MNRRRRASKVTANNVGGGGGGAEGRQDSRIERAVHAGALLLPSPPCRLAELANSH